jgi:hypothetical protein
VPARTTSATITLLSIAGCGILIDDTSTRIIKVDSLTVPSTVGPSDELVIEFHGFVGSDGCSVLSRVDRDVGADHLTIRFWAERTSGGGDCTQMPRLLEHVERIHPPLTDPYTITVIQPRGTPALIRTVRID